MPDPALPRYNCDCLPDAPDGTRMATDEEAMRDDCLYKQRWVYLVEDVEAHLRAVEAAHQQAMEQVNERHAHRLAVQEAWHRRELAKQQCVQCAGAISPETGRCTECDECSAEREREIEELTARAEAAEARLSALQGTQDQQP